MGVRTIILACVGCYIEGVRGSCLVANGAPDPGSEILEGG